MVTVPPQAPYLSRNMFIIKNQATTILINLPTMTRATIMVHIITLIQEHGQALLIGQALTTGQVTLIIHGLALITQDGQANRILGRVPITQDGLVNPILGRAPIIRDGLVNPILGRVPITQDGLVNRIPGRALIILEITPAHNTITRVHTILHGQASHTIGKVPIIQDGGVAHNTTLKVHTPQDGPANLIIGQAHITHQIGQAPITTTNQHGIVLIITIQAHIGQEALTIAAQDHIGVALIIIPRAITEEATVKAITITTTTITAQRSSPLMQFTITISVASRNTKRVTRMAILRPTREQPMKLSVREETRLSSLLTIGSLLRSRGIPPLRLVCCNLPTTQQSTQ